MHKDTSEYIPDTEEEKKHYTLTEAIKLLHKAEEEDEHHSCVSCMQDE